MTLEQILEAVEKLTPEERDLLVERLTKRAESPNPAFDAALLELVREQKRAIEEGRDELVDAFESLERLKARKRG